jgi:energy-coupling factor transporter ATP-binding protein EcfA2
MWPSDRSECRVRLCGVGALIVSLLASYAADVQLGRVSVAGLGRLANASMKVRGKVTAVVGPNEAGKSTLLRALAGASTSNPVSPGDIPRRTKPEGEDAAVEVTFVLDADDQALLAGIATDSNPTHIVGTKTYGGDVSHALSPLARRPRAPRRAAADVAEGVIGDVRIPDEGSDPELRALAQQLVSLAEQAKAILADPTDPSQLTAEALATLEQFRDAVAGTPPEVLEDVGAHDMLTAMLEVERAPHPNTSMMAALQPRIPLFALFSEADRALAYEYDLDGMTAETMPPALYNLATSGQLDVATMLADIAAGQWDAVAEHIADANDALKVLFEAAWSAGSGTAAVHLTLDGTTLRIMVTSRVGRFSPISERSDGLRTFVALTTFAHARTAGTRPVVMLIDEAENHLHYDAQADLMDVLARQEIASQVIYTTHSAGCLPDELGGNIVAVVPDTDTGHSSIESSYWTKGLGFSPLMMAMGAGAAAITPSRYAVLAEGHSEALALPRLIREATGLPRLGYQVAAGVAEAGGKDVPRLDAEAAHVVYLVDGDGGGASNAQKLERAGIPKERVIHLGGEASNLCLENLIEAGIYAAAADAARTAIGSDPSKTDVAAYLIDVDGELLAQDKIELVAALHAELSDALNIPKDRRPRLTSK